MIAQENADKLELDLIFHQGDALQPGTFKKVYDIILSNPPYIPPSEKSQMEAFSLAHELGLALFVPEENALLFYREIAGIATVTLAKSGHLFFETNEFNNSQVVELLQEMSFADVEARQDIRGKWRMVSAGK